MARNIKDADLIKTVALAAAGASSSTGSIDLNVSSGSALTENIELVLDIPVLSALVDAETVTVTIEDSADNSSFAAVAGLGTKVATGTETPGTAAAIQQRYRFPDNVRRYVRATAAVSASAGDNTGDSITISLTI
jgi:hypothetical protein